ncbi:MAG: DUF1127 domain-containing protein [Methyloligellaceae bacterium]
MAYIERHQDCANSQSLTGVKEFFKYSINLFLHCLNVAGERYKLSRLDDRMLKDIGLSKADVHKEVNRSFWDTPEPRD